MREVLVCDDGSTTDTRGVCEEFLQRIPGLRVLWQADLGFRAGQARNMGIREARGELLLFIDDDLLLPASFVESHVAAHARGRNGESLQRVVLGFRYRTQTPVRRLPPAVDEIVTSGPDDRIALIGPLGERLAAHPHPWFFVYSCNFSVPNDPQHVLFDEGFTGWGIEDIELGYRLVKAGYEVVVDPAANVLHVESEQPRDPFICADRGLLPCYDSYVRNAVQFIDKYPGDQSLRELLSLELRWYVRDETGRHWVKDGHEHDPEAVIAIEAVSSALAPASTPGEPVSSDSDLEVPGGAAPTDSGQL